MELLDAADGLRDQLALMQAAKSEGEPDTVGECIANAVGVMLKGAELQDDDGDAKLWLHPALNGSGG